jgi:glutamine amidotransferase
MKNQGINKFAIVDYGMGNLRSVLNAFKILGEFAYIAEFPEQIENADAIIIPGVGAFGEAMKNLNEMDIIETLNQKVLIEKKPFLGICLGMQLIAESSMEGGKHLGLGWIPGQVEMIPVNKGTRLPHIGWNDITVKQKEPLFRNIDGDNSFYFVHSYYLNCKSEYVSATVDYDVEITAAVQKDNIYAVQFHPEKSQNTGLILLRQFINVVYEKRGLKETYA